MSTILFKLIHPFETWKYDGELFRRKTKQKVYQKQFQNNWIELNEEKYNNELFSKNKYLLEEKNDTKCNT